MEIGHGVSLGSFGSFKPVIAVKTVKAQDDATAETIRQKKVRFFPGKDFRVMMAEMGVEDYSTFDFTREGSEVE